MKLLQVIKDALLHLAFPDVCEGCGSDRCGRNPLCIRCHSSLPSTHFHKFAGNPVEKIFWGRLPLMGATANYYFTKQSIMQTLMHEFKYNGNKELGHYLGVLMGHELNNSERFLTIDALVPLPLHKDKQKKRGYNQAAILCDGIAEVIKKPVLTHAVDRNTATETQTKKSRVERWQNMEGKFSVNDPLLLANKHVLLVDDVVTTGATLEACGQELLKIPGMALSIGTLCCSFS